jgi:hypothetical protein
VFSALTSPAQFKRKRKRLTRSTTKSFGFYSSSLSSLSQPHIDTSDEILSSSVAQEGLLTHGSQDLPVPTSQPEVACDDATKGNADSMEAPAVKSSLWRSPIRNARRYGRKRRNAQGSSRATVDEIEGEGADEHLGKCVKRRRVDCSRSSPQAAKHSWRKRVARPLAERLIRADALILGGPAQDMPQTGRTRLPLRLIEAEELMDEKDRTKPQLPSFVDPRTVSPFHLASSSFSGRRPQTGKTKTLTHWRTLHHQGFSRHKITTPSVRARMVTGGCTPLTFVPMDEAEKTYASRLDRSK